MGCFFVWVVRVLAFFCRPGEDPGGSGAVLLGPFGVFLVFSGFFCFAAWGCFGAVCEVCWAVIWVKGLYVRFGAKKVLYVTFGFSGR